MEITDHIYSDWSDLHEALCKGDNNSDADLKDEKGRTPIHIAASHGKEKIVELLLGKVKDGRECERQE